MNATSKALLLQAKARKPPKILPKDIYKSWKIVKGDQVQVIAGDDKGHIGSVIKVSRDTNQIFVSGANLARKHFKTGIPNQGLVLNIEKGIDISNVSLLDPIDNKPVRVKVCYIKDQHGVERIARVSVRSGYEIPKPSPYQKIRIEGPLDTKPDIVTNVTFKPDIRSPPTPLDCVLSPHYHF